MAKKPIQEHTEAICPCCGDGCSLDDPHCSKGVKYARAVKKRAAVESSNESSVGQAPLQKKADGKRKGRRTMGPKEKNVDEQLLGLFQSCVHTLHHRRGRNQAQGQGRLLNILFHKGSITQRKLMDIMDIRSASLSELLGKLEANGYIVREQNADDRRIVDITITDEGRVKAKEMKQRRIRMAESLFAVLDEDEKQQLAATLSKLSIAWEEDDASDAAICDKHAESHFRKQADGRRRDRHRRLEKEHGRSRGKGRH